MTQCNPNTNCRGLIVWGIFFTLIFSGCTATLSTQPTTNEIVRPTGLIGFYQGSLNHLSSVRRGSCPMHPTCSEYAHQALTKHGPVIGWMMATDRLLRCGRDETRLATKVWVGNRLKYYDPLEQNDYWWKDNPKKPLSRMPQ